MAAELRGALHPLALSLLSSLFVLILSDSLTNSPSFEVVCSKEEEEWRRNAIAALWKERKSMGHTPLFKIHMPGFPNVELFMKNETATASGSLKHRFAWALVLWAVLEGKIRPNTRVYDSTSGNTGASEAYMCRLIGVPFYATVAKEIEVDKAQHIESMGGQLLRVALELRSREAERLGNHPQGFFINQFGNADRAEESHESASFPFCDGNLHVAESRNVHWQKYECSGGNFTYESTNVFHEILVQFAEMKKEIPDYFIHSAGTGGTISSVGRFVQRYGLPTRIVLADSQYSLFYDYVKHEFFTEAKDGGHNLWKGPGVAGIGYGYEIDPVIFGNSTSVIHEVARVKDIATIAGVRVLRRLETSTGRHVNGGPSSALNFLVALAYAHRHPGAPKKPTSLVTILCDPGSFYTTTYLNDTWVEKNAEGGVRAMKCWEEAIEKAVHKGGDFLEFGRKC